MPQKTSKKKASAVKSSSSVTYSKLRKYNLIAALLYAIQGVIILVLSDGAKGVQSITANFLAQDKLASDASQTVNATATHHLLDLNLAYLIAAFFFIGAIVHLLIATWKRKTYEKDLKQGINRIRWVEYGLSTGVMMIAIAVLAGVFDVASLLMIFALTAIMSSLGLVMELRNQGMQQTDWSNYWIGVVAGLVPWLVLAIYMWNSIVYGSGLDSFIYVIYASLLLIFTAFAVNMYLQYKKLGRWATYLYGEKVYIVLSFIAKTALAWQIFAGTLS